MDTRSTNFISLFLTLFIIRSAASQDCRTPIGTPGYCTSIRQCRPLLIMLKTYGTSAGPFLRDSVCYFDSDNPVLCCPIDDNSNDDRNQDIMTSPPAPPPPTPAPLPPRRDLQPSIGSNYGPLFPPDCGFVDNGTYTKVVGGIPAALGNWPWMAALGYHSKKNPRKPNWLCGGSLISSRHVLTAAHCIFRRTDLYIVRLGDLNLDDAVNDNATPMNVLIDGSTIHPEYSSTQYTNDIAIIKLAENVQFTRLIKPICIPYLSGIADKDFTDTLPFIAGWGSIYFRGPTDSHLQQVQLPVYSAERCKSAYRPFKNTVIDDRVLCAGYPDGGKDACQGDSGGPMMSVWGNKESAFPKKSFYVIGVISYGYRCADPGMPGVYTRVSKFLDFIRDNLN